MSTCVVGYMAQHAAWQAESQALSADCCKVYKMERGAYLLKADSCLCGMIQQGICINMRYIRFMKRQQTRKEGATELALEAQATTKVKNDRFRSLGSGPNS